MPDEAWVAGAVLVLGVAASGAGPLNGDIAVYVDQAADGHPFARWVHVGFVLLLMMFRWVPDLQMFADLVAALAAAVGVFTFARSAPEGRGIVAVFLGGLVLPAAGFGEVDPLWFALAGLGMLAGPVGGGICLALAVTVSPTALALMPWILWNRPDRRWIGVVAAVGLLTVLSTGDWWWGVRGLAHGWSPSPGRWLGWLLPSAALVVLGWRGPREQMSLLLVLPALLAPGDVPGHWVIGLALAFSAARTMNRTVGLRALGWVGAAFLWGAATTILYTTRQATLIENAGVAEVAALVRPQDGLQGPWSWTTRVSLLATGDENGVPVAWNTNFCVPQRERVFVHAEGVRWLEGHSAEARAGCD